MPSMLKASSTLKAAVRATRANKANSSHEERMVESMFALGGGRKHGRKRKWATGRRERGYV